MRSLEVFDQATFDAIDNRFDYGEERTVTFGALDGRWVIVVCVKTRMAAARRDAADYFNEVRK